MHVTGRLHLPGATGRAGDDVVMEALITW